MLGLLVLMVALMVWLMPRLWRGIMGLISRLSLPRWSAGSNP